MLPRENTTKHRVERDVDARDHASKTFSGAKNCMGRTSKAFRYSGVKRKRSIQQKEHTSAGLAHQDQPVPDPSTSTPPDANKENPVTVALSNAKTRGDNYQAETYKARRKLKKAEHLLDNRTEALAQSKTHVRDLESSVTGLESRVSDLTARNGRLADDVASEKSARQKMSQTLHNFKQTVRRIPDRIETATSKVKSVFAKNPPPSAVPVLKLKEKGIIPDTTRDIINDMAALDGIGPTHVADVLKRVADHLGVRVEGSLSDRSIRHIVKEGGVASSLQFVEAVSKSKGVTASSDGTTHKNINLESRRATVIGTDNSRKTFFLGIEMAINHTSATQLEGWEEGIDEIYQTYRDSGREETVENVCDWWLHVTGWHSDHAEDQKKLFRDGGEKKVGIDRVRRGEDTLLEMVPEEMTALLFQVSQDVVAKAGGIAAWESLPAEERRRLHDEAYTAFKRALGQAAFEKLGPQEQQNIDLFIWGGCCMHKSMNVFKGGCLAMAQWWKDHMEPGVGPLKMYNRDNAATVKDTGAAGTSAAARAEERTSGGAIKVSSLAGAIFRHKDRKRGQQDTLRYFFDFETNHNICFPDTSNTRFQSHATACEVIVLHMPILLEFLDYVKQNKGTRMLNHMELNVQRGLSCPYTRHEFVAIALYNQNIDVPYMRQIRGPLRLEKNLLKLGPLHASVKAHLQRIIENPKLITGLDATFETATLDGKPWQKPDVVYAALRMISELEHVDEIVVALFKGVLATWGRFDTEWNEDGAIAKLTPENIERAWLEATNDGNESELGILRVAAKGAPNISLPYHNALRMYKANETSDYTKSLPSNIRGAIRKQARKDDSSGRNRAKKHAQIVEGKRVAEQKLKKDAVRSARAAQAKANVESTNVFPTVADLEKAFQIAPRSPGYLAIAALDLQLDWLIAHPLTFTRLDKSLVDSAAGIPKFKSGAKGRGDRDGRFKHLRDAIQMRLDVAEMMLEGMEVDTEGSEGPEEDLDYEMEAAVEPVEEISYLSDEDWYADK